MFTDNSFQGGGHSELAAAESGGKMQEQARELLASGARDNAVALSRPAAEATAIEYSKAAAALPSITINDHLPTAQASTENRSVVVVDKSHHKTHILQKVDGQVEDVLTVKNATGTGKSGQVTPEGKFHVIAKETNPWWYPPPSIGGKPVPPGPHNPLGPRKIRTDAYGGRVLLHGTNRPDQIGTNASHGCIRHLNEDIKRVYPLVQPGDAVYIVKDINGTHINPEDFRQR
jgi:lipoprotein-anchoring transpeptidase ErfK/SrfK